MKAYIINPSLTIGDCEISKKFYEVLEKELSEHVEITVVRSDAVMNSLRFNPEDLLVFFNRHDQNYSKNFISLLKEFADSKSSKDQKTDIIPVAITKETRVPPEEINLIQSFDVTDHIRRRRLELEQMPLIAVSLARTIITRMQPTLSKDNMKLFISHRRLDGEEIAAAFCRELRARAEDTFRDLIDIRVGDDAQEEIEKNLRLSDAVILLDTPKTGDSIWVEKEIQLALGLNLPIVWVRIGQNEDRTKLKTPPSGEPHFIIADIDVSKNEVPPELIDQIIQKGFEISREFSKCVFDQMQFLKSIAKENGMILEEKDRRRMIYQVTIPRTGFKYYQRPMTHLIQFFGRSPKENDLAEFIPAITQIGYDSHPLLGPVYDTPILLAPIPEQKCEEKGGAECIVDSFDEYVNAIQFLNSNQKPVVPTKRGVIISGAFPDCEPEHQQSLTDAIHAITHQIFLKKGKVIFGAHPTFQHLIFDLGKRMFLQNVKDHITLYISKYFATDPLIKQYTNEVNVIATDVVDTNRQKSLTLMRKKMIEDGEAIALIALGGKTDAGGHLPGVDEEIRLAQEAGIPVFIIGSVGGRTAQLSKDFIQKDIATNGLKKEENKELMMSKDYRNIANKILTQLNL
jgi:hypothetical protein